MRLQTIIITAVLIILIGIIIINIVPKKNNDPFGLNSIPHQNLQTIMDGAVIIPSECGDTMCHPYEIIDCSPDCEGDQSFYDPARHGSWLFRSNADINSKWSTPNLICVKSYSLFINQGWDSVCVPD
ncbi:hypothetical protein K9M79_03105 [Candidatus Woesearchaeota archaeon]|nr:hypothetical protein [Candidatus Woesearchaeota archaeon]